VADKKRMAVHRREWEKIGRRVGEVDQKVKYLGVLSSSNEVVVMIVGEVGVARA
jgi:hypothetical protein